MKCPACRARLHKIPYMEGEYVCHNEDCPAKTDSMIVPEWYGLTQKEVNKMWRKCDEASA